MPFRVRKSGSKFLIQKKTMGLWKTIGKSDSEKDANISVSIRRRESGEK